MKFKNWINAHLLLAPDGDGSGGGNSQDDTAIRDTGFQKLAERYQNDGIGLAKDLYSENYTYRRKNADLTTQLNEAKGKVPAEGSVVLTGDQAIQWAAYQALGTPDKVKEQVDERVTLQGKLDTAARETLLRQVAEVAKFNYAAFVDADMLALAKGGKQPSYEIGEVDINGEKSKVAYVKDGDVKKPLVEYATENWGSLLPSLTLADPASQRANNGTVYPSQHSGSGTGTKPTTAKAQTDATLNQHYPSRKVEAKK